MEAPKRLTKKIIESDLLAGKPVQWTEDKKKKQIILETPVQRRLFSFLLSSKVRDPKNLTQEFVADLEKAYLADDDPASSVKSEISEIITDSWRLHSIKTEGFGGLNLWNGPEFTFKFDKESHLVEGANGSGKSSIVGAILWALTGDRPRDQTNDTPHEVRPVFDSNDQTLGNWPPIACYPTNAASLSKPPLVSVELTFENASGETAQVKRILKDGTVTVDKDPKFKVPSVFIETGILMPTRLGTLRFDEGKGRLADAVQKLTGLDDLISIGALVGGISHGAKDYLAPIRKESVNLTASFNHLVGETRGILESVSELVPEFDPVETLDAESNLAAFGKNLGIQAAKLTAVVADDISPSLDIKNSAVQNDVISALSSAQDDLDLGLKSLPTWNLIANLAECINLQKANDIRKAIDKAAAKINIALNLHSKSIEDSKFQLKAVASLWHVEHAEGPIENCPLCETNITENDSLLRELKELKALGQASSKTLNDNLNSILEELRELVPSSVFRFELKEVNFELRSNLIAELNLHFVTRSKYSTVLANFGGLMEKAIASAPPCKFQATYISNNSSLASKAFDKLATIDRCLSLAEWYNVEGAQWLSWWDDVCGKGEHQKKSPLIDVLSRVSEALAKADPYRRAADSLRRAWAEGARAVKAANVLRTRESIVEKLASLKLLGALAENVASNAILGLSGRIESMLGAILLTEKLRFKKAHLKKKEGLIVHGSVADDFHIDATLVANTAWLRAVLWAFIFCLREEAADQLDIDPLPLLAFDDPQATFDGLHRHRWAQQIAKSQKQIGFQAQVLLFTHDEAFLELVKVSGVRGRSSMLLAAGPEFGTAKFFEGAALQRKWEEVSKSSSPDWSSYIARVREYVEGLLRIMLRGESSSGSSPLHGYTVGKARDKILQLYNNGLPPWNRKEFKDLVEHLDKNKSTSQHMEICHHSGGYHLGKAEASDLKTFWKTHLEPALDSAFRVAREFYHLHGRLTALHEPAPSSAFPNGHPEIVKKLPLKILGRAAALTNGKMADGRIEVEHFDEGDFQRYVLGTHSAFRLIASTLEPVAKRGDIILVKDKGEPDPKSLVLTMCDDRRLARRYDIARNHSDIAVLAAQTTHPHRIAAPVVAHKDTIEMRKVIGVLYDYNSSINVDVTDMEFEDCAGEASLNKFSADAMGLVKVEGSSAVPYALHGQFLLTGHPVFDWQSIRSHASRPVIVEDTSELVYFKRLQILDYPQIVLESLDNSGDYEPIVLSAPGAPGVSIKTLWPVLGVIFER